MALHSALAVYVSVIRVARRDLIVSAVVGWKDRNVALVAGLSGLRGHLHHVGVVLLRYVLVGIVH